MIREEEILKAAEEFAFSDKTETPDLYDVINDFYYGAKWADKTMINKACEIAKDILSSYSFANYSHEIQDFLIDFRKAMEE